MAMNFDFSESLEMLNLTFYKPPTSEETKEETSSTPDAYLKNDQLLVFNGEEIPLYAPVEMVTIRDHRLKTEVVLKKIEPKKWHTIQGKLNKIEVNDAIYKDDESENKNQDLMGLFRDIYSRGDENTKRAMNKSLQESCGTVLSTNWEEVKSKAVQPEK